MNSIMKTILIVLGFCIAGFVGWTIGKNDKEPVIASINENVIAVVNNHAISKDYFIAKMKSRGGLKPGQYQSLQQKESLLQVLINQEIMFTNAKKKGVYENEVVQDLLKKVVIDQYLNAELKPKLAKVSVKNKEVKKYFDGHKQSYDKPERRRAAIIFKEFFGKDTAEDKEVKKELLVEAVSKLNELDKKTLHFGVLAKTYSDDRNSRYQGGVIGWLINHPSRKYKWDDKVINALFTLEEPGDISPIIETNNGYYVVRLVSEESKKERSLSKVEKGIKNRLLQDKRKQARQDFMDGLSKTAKITINKTLLADIKPLSSPLKDKRNRPPALPGTVGE